MGWLAHLGKVAKRRRLPCIYPSLLPKPYEHEGREERKGQPRSQARVVYACCCASMCVWCVVCGVYVCCTHRSPRPTARPTAQLRHNPFGVQKPEGERYLCPLYLWGACKQARSKRYSVSQVYLDIVPKVSYLSGQEEEGRRTPKKPSSEWVLKSRETWSPCSVAPEKPGQGNARARYVHVEISGTGGGVAN